MAFKAPPNNPGYDLVCCHPLPERSKTQLRVQVKSRIATDSDKSILVKPQSLPHFDFLVVVYLNAGFYFRKAKSQPTEKGLTEPEVLVVPKEVVSSRFSKSSTWGKVRFKPEDFEKYSGRAGINLIADRLEIPYPSKITDGT